MKLHTFFLTVISTFLFSCSESSSNKFKKISFPSKHLSTTTNKEITILPLGNKLPTAFINTVESELRNFLPQVKVKQGVPLPLFAYNTKRGRYRADSLIKWMSKMAKPNEVIIGITNVDISTTKDQHQDWGVMGLGYRPGNAAIASSFRLKNKSQFWKIAIHELGHTAGLPHCQVKSCFMRDAKGGDHTNEENSFCGSCKSILIKMNGS